MHNARDHERAHPDTSTIPSRRRLFASLSATLLAGAAIATAAHGAPVAALPARGGDAELLALCAEFHHHHAAAFATPVDDDVALTAALDERWNISDEIRDIAATTDAGRRAKAALVLMVENEGAEPVDQASVFVLAALQDMVGSAAAHRIVPTAESADAELIRLCERLVAWEAKYDAIYLTVEDDDEADRRTAPMLPEFDEIRDRLYELDAPTTRQGRRAFAQAALATASRDSSGAVMLDTGGGLSPYLAFGLAHSMAGRTVRAMVFIVVLLRAGGLRNGGSSLSVGYEQYTHCLFVTVAPS